MKGSRVWFMKRVEWTFQRPEAQKVPVPFSASADPYDLRGMASFSLRSWTSADLEALLRHGNDPGIAANMTDAFPHPYTEESGRAFLTMCAGQDPQRILCIDVDGEAAGALGLHPQGDVYRRNAELGYWLGRAHWGKGIMTEAVGRMVEYGWSTLPVDRIFARPFGSNTASQRVLQKAGFTLEARLVGTFEKNGVREDELIYAVRRAR
jgi:ribosomal-protein-alanine N-acetyltransferase